MRDAAGQACAMTVKLKEDAMKLAFGNKGRLSRTA
jgi:hypothetical protein